MVKVAGNEKHVKYVKTRKFNEIRDKFTKVGGNRIFSEIGGRYSVLAKIGGKVYIQSQ